MRESGRLYPSSEVSGGPSQRATRAGGPAPPPPQATRASTLEKGWAPGPSPPPHPPRASCLYLGASFCPIHQAALPGSLWSSHRSRLTALANGTAPQGFCRSVPATSTSVSARPHRHTWTETRVSVCSSRVAVSKGPGGGRLRGSLSHGLKVHQAKPWAIIGAQ